jgi:hypothetical protein
MSNWEMFAYMMNWVIGGTAVIIVGGMICDWSAAISERRRRKKYRNNYVRFK